MLDAQWSKYLQFEENLTEELALHISDFEKRMTVYATKMENRFDNFFHEIGEKTIIQILAFSSNLS